MSQRRTKSKASRGFVTRTIKYRDSRSPTHVRPQEIKVDMRDGATLETEHAAAMVAVRVGIPLLNVRVLKITC